MPITKYALAEIPRIGTRERAFFLEGFVDIHPFHPRLAYQVTNSLYIPDSIRFNYQQTVLIAHRLSAESYQSGTYQRRYHRIHAAMLTLIL